MSDLLGRKLTKILYLDTSKTTFGDGQISHLWLHKLKEMIPYSVICYAGHEASVRTNSILMTNSGLIDDVISIQHHCCDDTDLTISTLKKNCGSLKYDILALGWCLNVDISKIIAHSGIFQNDINIYVVKFGAERLYSGIIEFKSLCEMYLPNANELYTYKDIDMYTGDMLSVLDDTKKTVGLFPLSTRIMSTIHPEGFNKLVRALSERYNVILMGSEWQLYSNGILGSDYKQTPGDINCIRDADAYNMCYDWVGISPLKQISIGRKIHCFVMSPTGAVIFPLLHKINSVVICGGEYSPLFYSGFTDFLHAVPVGCDNFPCDSGGGRTRNVECSAIPQCLDKDIPVDQVIYTIESIRRNNG